MHRSAAFQPARTLPICLLFPNGHLVNSLLRVLKINKESKSLLPYTYWTPSQRGTSPKRSRHILTPHNRLRLSPMLRRTLYRDPCFSCSVHIGQKKKKGGPIGPGTTDYAQSRRTVPYCPAVAVSRYRWETSPCSRWELQQRERRCENSDCAAFNPQGAEMRNCHAGSRRKNAWPMDDCPPSRPIFRLTTLSVAGP